jgi:hypothetical protein
MFIYCIPSVKKPITTAKVCKKSRKVSF